MKLKVVLKTLMDFFSTEKIDCALIGAFALKAYGYVRATQDVDFLVRAGNQEKIVRHLEAMGYETVHRSTGFSNHVHPIPGFGRLDFVYVEAETAEAVFSQCKSLLLLEDFYVPVVKAEHLIALKVFAMKNDPDRTYREMADIQQLLRLPEIDLTEVRGYFERYGQLEKYQELTGKGKANADA